MGLEVVQPVEIWLVPRHSVQCFVNPLRIGSLVNAVSVKFGDVGRKV